MIPKLMPALSQFTFASLCSRKFFTDNIFLTEGAFKEKHEALHNSTLSSFLHYAQTLQ